MPSPPLRALVLASLTACGPVVPATTDTSTGTLDPTTTTPDPTTDNTSTSTGTPTTADATDTMGLIMEPDIPGCTNDCVTCDLYEQDCPADQKCTPYAQDTGSTWNATRCVPVTGDGVMGDPCTATHSGFSGLDDCALGHICWDVDEQLNGICIALCTGSPDAPECPGTSVCSISDAAALDLCIQLCDPLANDCPDGNVCVSHGSRFQCVLDASGEGGHLNDPCESSNACDPGLVCVVINAASSACNKDSNGCCTPYCKLPDAPCPNPDQQCLPWSDMPNSPQTEHIGVCAVPR